MPIVVLIWRKTVLYFSFERIDVGKQLEQPSSIDLHFIFKHSQVQSTIQTTYPERRTTMQEHSGATTMKGNPLTLVVPELSI
jgi:hypothetical protein